MCHPVIAEDGTIPRVIAQMTSLAHHESRIISVKKVDDAVDEQE